MATIRLDSDERRKAIVAAAVPLFARRGFAGTTTRELFEATFERVHPLFVASVEAAAAAGDLRAEPIASANRFWFGHHVAAMVAFVLLPGRASVPYQGSVEALAEEASWFILRGIGMRDTAIAYALAVADDCLF